MDTSIVDLPLDHVLVIDNYRSEYSPQTVARLAANMRQRGFMRKRAIGVYGVELGNIRTRQTETFYVVIEGNTRTLAAKQAELTTIPAEISAREPMRNRLDQLEENENRVKPNDIDLARGIKDALDLGATMDEVLESIGQTDPAYVERRLALLSLIPDIQQLVAKRQLPITYAAAMANLDSNRQRMAVQAYNKAKSPNVNDFKDMCERLYTEQLAEGQTDFFGLYTPEEMAAKEAELAESISSAPKRSIKALEAEIEALRKARAQDRQYAIHEYSKAQKEIAALKAALQRKTA